MQCLRHRVYRLFNSPAWQTLTLSYIPLPEGDAAPSESYLQYVVEHPVEPEEALEADRLRIARMTYPPNLRRIPASSRAAPGGSQPEPSGHAERGS